MDLTIKSIPTQAIVDRIKDSAMNIIKEMTKPVVSAEKQAEYETNIDAILVANNLPKVFDKEIEVIEK